MREMHSPMRPFRESSYILTRRLQREETEEDLYCSLMLQYKGLHISLEGMGAS